VVSGPKKAFYGDSFSSLCLGHYLGLFASLESQFERVVVLGPLLSQPLAIVSWYILLLLRDGACYLL
jgi:hypothetical protein